MSWDDCQSPWGNITLPSSAGSMGLPLLKVASCDLINPGICLPCAPWGLLAKNQRCCCPLMPWHKAPLTPNREMPQCCSQKFLGQSMQGGVLLGDIGTSHAKAGFSATRIVDTLMAPKSWSETPCGSFPCMLTSGQCLLNNYLVSCRMRFCTHSDYMAALWLSVFCPLCSLWKDGCLFLYPRISFVNPALMISLMLSGFSGCFDIIILNCLSVVSSFCNSNVISYSLGGWELL